MVDECNVVCGVAKQFSSGLTQRQKALTLVFGGTAVALFGLGWLIMQKRKNELN